MNRKRLAAALAYVDEKAKRLTSLDQPQESDAVDMALEMGGSFIPGVGQALAARDFERARRADDEAGMAMAAASALPVGRLVGALKGFDPAMREIDVYHGSPHRFEEFDASKIGTGEGAQAYGHGIYLAESPDVAKQYKKASDLTPEELEKQLKYALYKAETSNDPLVRDAFKNAAAQLKQSGGKQGSLYTADLPDEMVDRMLDWDKPLSEQPEFVQKAWADWRNSPQAQKLVKQMGSRGLSAQDLEKTFGNPTGAAMHKWIYEGFGSSKGGEMPKVAQFLKGKGLVGVKYQDAGSRGQGGSGTRNFVVFPGEEKKVKILRRE
jgi:hypothetical protein